MRLFAILAMGIFFSDAAVGDTQVIPTPVCYPAHHAEIVVTKLGHAVTGARVDIYRQIDHGERTYWTGLTDANGTVRPPELPIGRYRLFGDAGEDSSAMFLLVDDHAQDAKCRLELSKEVSKKAELPILTKRTPNVTLASFKGVVQDEGKAVIPRLKIEVLRRESLQTGPVARAESNEKGQFDLQLPQGSYVAVFSYQGFRRRSLAFTIGSKGWQGIQLTMIVGGLETEDPLPTEWNPD